MWTLFTASTQAGVDQPPTIFVHPEYAGESCCSDPRQRRDAADGVNRLAVRSARTTSSAGDRRFRAGIRGGSAQPDWDKILVLVNSGTYGGSGGNIGSSPRIAGGQCGAHEFVTASPAR